MRISELLQTCLYKQQFPTVAGPLTAPHTPQKISGRRARRGRETHAESRAASLSRTPKKRGRRPHLIGFGFLLLCFFSGVVLFERNAHAQTYFYSGTGMSGSATTVEPNGYYVVLYGGGYAFYDIGSIGLWIDENGNVFEWGVAAYNYPSKTGPISVATLCGYVDGCLNNSAEYYRQLDDNGNTVAYYYNPNASGSWSVTPPPAVVKNLGSPSPLASPDLLPSSPANPSLPTRADSDSCGCIEGNPINAATGNKFEVETDFIGAPQTGLALTRYYNSLGMNAGVFGLGWTSTWHRGLTVSGGAVTSTRADGHQETFTKNASGAWVPDPDVTDTLSPVPATGTQTGWKLTTAADTAEYYTLSGQLISLVTRAGLVTTLAYDAGSRLTTVTGPFGHTLTFTFDAANRVTTMTTPDGGVYTYGYDDHDRLASVTYPDTSLRTYMYENPVYHLLTGILDENGARFASWTYDSQTRAISSQHAGGADLTTLTYNADGTVTATDARGNVHGYTLTTLFNMVKPLTVTGVPFPNAGGQAFTYDANGFLASKTDFNGHVTTYVHDTRGNETSRVEASGTSVARTIITVWHPTFHLPKQIFEPNRTTTFTYDTNGNLLTHTITAGTRTRTWTYTYNTNGQVLTKKDPRGSITAWSYDANGNMVTMTDAVGHVTKYTSYDANGRLLSMTDPNGLVATYTYDQRGRPLTKALGAEKITYTYDLAGLLKRVTFPDTSFLSYTYDAAHRLTTVKDKAGDYVLYTLDATSNVTKVKVYDPANVLRRTHSYTYDTANRVLWETGTVTGEKTTYAYDNQSNLLGVTDPLTHKTSITYDALNRPTKMIDATGGSTIFAYNANDDVTSVKDPRGLTTSYVFDGLDNQTSLTSPDTGTTQRTFNAAGYVLTLTDARGVTTTYTYDALNRVKTITFPDGQVTFTYAQGLNGTGHLTQMNDGTGQTNWTYDQHGRVLSKTQKVGTVSLTVRYGYDAFGRLSSVTYPSGQVVRLTYSFGRVTGLTVNSAPLVTDIQYDPFGAPHAWT